MSSQSEGLLASLEQQTAEERQKPAAVLEDVENEKAQYEKDLLQGAGGLLIGGAAERGLKGLRQSGKGKAALKRLGMSDEDIDTFTDAIKSRDTGAITDLLIRKGTGYVEKVGNKLVGKGIQTAKDAKSAVQDSEAFQKIQQTASDAINTTTNTLKDTIGELPGKASAAVEDLPGIFGSGGGGFGGGFGTPSSAFSGARAEVEGEANLEEQSQAVKNMLSKSKAGRRLLKRNARKRARGEPLEDEPNNPIKTEFDVPDTAGDYIQGIRDAAQRDFVQAKQAVQPEAVELNPLTGEELNPLETAKKAKQSVNDDFDRAIDDANSFGNRDPYQDVYDEADRAAQRFTDIGDTLIKPNQISFEAPRISRTEHMKQLADEQQKFEDSLPDFGDLVTGSGAGGGKPTADAIQEEAPREAPVPPSQQTGGLDPSQLPDDAGYSRGANKIKAKKPVDDATPAEPITEPEKELKPLPENPEEALPPVTAEKVPGTFDEHPVFDILQKQQEQQPKIVDSKPVEPTEQKQKIEEQQQPSTHNPQPNQEDIQPAAQNDSDLGSTDKTLGEEIGGSAERDTAEKVGGDLSKAFEASLGEDAVDPAGIIVSGLLGVGALIGGLFRKSHHPHFVQPPALHPTENFSVQMGVA